MKKEYEITQSKDLGTAEYEISATIAADTLNKYRERAIKTLGENVEVPGFRKGHVPADMLLGHLGEERVMDKASTLALTELYPEIIKELNIDAIGSPKIEVKKLAKDNPMEFVATTAIMPEIKLPDYKKIAKKVFEKKEEVAVTDKEVEETLTHIRRQRAQIESYEKQKSEGAEKPEIPEIDDKNLPELTDEFVQTLGDFKTVADFEKKVRENILEEKKLKEIERKRIETVEQIIKESDIILPQIMIDQEIHRIEHQVEAEVAQTGTKMEDYLKNIGKTIEELRKEWAPEAEKRAKLQLILNEIANKEGIETDKEEIQREVAHIKEHYPDADEENVRIYVETTKRNELVFKSFENTDK